MSGCCAHHHRGSGIWLAERISGLLSLPLTVWLVWEAVQMGDWSYGTFSAWLAEPVNAVLLGTSVPVFFYHAFLGVSAIVEDYVHTECLRKKTLCAFRAAFVVTALVCLGSILKVFFA